MISLLMSILGAREDTPACYQSLSSLPVAKIEISEVWLELEVCDML
jgi:hypothetical protein